MISAEVRFQGFDERSWLRMLSLLGIAAGRPDTRQVVVVVDAEDRALAAFTSDGHPVATRDYTGRGELPTLCASLGAPRGVVVRTGAIEFIVEQAAELIPMPGDYLAQCLTLLQILRRAEAAGAISFYPQPRRAPVPGAAMVERALDLLLPDDRSLVIAVFEQQQLWSSLVLRRRRGDIDLVAGPRLLSAWTGPLGGDYRRDHRTIRAAVGRNAAPVHLGVFGERAQLLELLRNPFPGAWAAAFATRDIVVDPAPPYIGVAAAADAGRALTGVMREFLGGVDLLSSAGPLAELARDRLGRMGRVSSVTSILGFNPLQALAERLQGAPPPDDTP